MSKVVIAGGNDNYAVGRVIDYVKSESDAPFPLEPLLKEYGVVLVMQETSREELRDLDADLPTDTHLVEYINTMSDTKGFDAVRAFKKSDIFDAYSDLGCKVIAIESGYGRIKPKLWVDARKDGDKVVKP